MSVKYKSNTAMVKFSVERGAALAIRNMLNDTHKVAKPNTPKDTRDLSINVVIQILGTAGTIVWLEKYAVYQENPKKKFNYTTPGTGPHFARNAVKEVVGKSGEYFDKAMNITAVPRLK